jgi:hypothetical protein
MLPDSETLGPETTDPVNSYSGGFIVQGGATLSVPGDAVLGNLSGGV